jgi:hypothetical protein
MIPLALRASGVSYHEDVTRKGRAARRSGGVLEEGVLLQAGDEVEHLMVEVAAAEELQKRVAGAGGEEGADIVLEDDNGDADGAADLGGLGEAAVENLALQGARADLKSAGGLGDGEEERRREQSWGHGGLKDGRHDRR